MIPKTLDGLFVLLVGLALAVMTSYSAYMVHAGQPLSLWAVLVNGGLGYLALMIRGGGMTIRTKPGEEPDDEG